MTELQFHVNNGTLILSSYINATNNNTTTNINSPAGKASGPAASKCVDVDQQCSPGQYIAVYSDKSVCYDAPINYYCYNGRCLYDCSTISSSASSNSYSMYGSSCVGSTGNMCDSTYRSDGPRSSLTGATACTSSANGYFAGIHPSND